MRIQDRRDLVVRVQRKELGRQLIIAVESDLVRFVRQADLFEHDRDFDTIGRRQGIELNPVRVLRRPFLGDRERGQIGHGKHPVTN
ncbi:hypothetical protein D3C81_1926030 [compost metagenome]